MKRPTTFYDTDVLVIGSGIAGLFYALQAARWARVTILTKNAPDESNTRYAQGGIAGVFGDDDDFESHLRDTLEAGDGLCNPNVVETMVREAPELIRELAELGARFTRQDDGRPVLGLEGGHSRKRIVHAKDATGNEVERALLCAVCRLPNVTIRPFTIVLDLSVAQGSYQRCEGAFAIDLSTGEPIFFAAQVIMLAAGGAGQLYARTTNPLIATGDGIATAYRAGAEVANLEFMQFHPTVLRGVPPFLISEALRGFGATLKRSDGSPLPIPHPLASLAPRDTVARAVFQETLRTGGEVFLDATELNPAALRRSFPAIYETCLKRGIDITRQAIPVAPAAHYLCGGVVTDINGRTAIERLYACGENACTGAHGANRLASNSLLEALVFAKRAERHARENGLYEPRGFPINKGTETINGNGITKTWALGRDSAIFQEAAFSNASQPLAPAAKERIEVLSERIRTILWERVGVLRSNEGLRSATEAIEEIRNEAESLYRQHRPTAQSAELRNMALVGFLTARAASSRKESRGTHWNEDYPAKDERFAHAALWSKTERSEEFSA